LKGPEYPADFVLTVGLLLACGVKMIFLEKYMISIQGTCLA